MPIMPHTDTHDAIRPRQVQLQSACLIFRTLSRQTYKGLSDQDFDEVAIDHSKPSIHSIYAAKVDDRK